MSDKKRRHWKEKEPDWTLIEFTPSDIKTRGDDGFKQHLKRCLEERGLECRKLSEDEIWLKI